MGFFCLLDCHTRLKDVLVVFLILIPFLVPFFTFFSKEQTFAFSSTICCLLLKFAVELEFFLIVSYISD